MTDTWLTPPAIVEALGGWESFDLDPCASIDQPTRTARRQITETDNGLLVSWHGRVWVNPPYSSPLVVRFMARLAEHGRGTSLTFARTETEWFHRYVWPVAAGVLFIRGRLRFLLPDGSSSRKDAGAPSILLAYGDEDLERLAAAPIDGSFLPIRWPRQFVGFGQNVRSDQSSTWGGILAEFFAERTEALPLADIYRALADHPKTQGNRFWRDKLRQELQLGPYDRVEKGVWRRAA